MKKINIFLCMILVFFLSACVSESDGTIIYNNNKYFPREDSSTIFMFHGNSHFVRNYGGIVAIRKVHCLDADVDKNILFVYNDYENVPLNRINSWFWVKNKECIPNDDTSIQSIKIVDIRLWPQNQIELSLKNTSFNEVFVEAERPNLMTQFDYFRIGFSYENIDCYDEIGKDENDDIYVTRRYYYNDSEDSRIKEKCYKLLNEYKDEFDSALEAITILINTNENE